MGQGSEEGREHRAVGSERNREGEPTETIVCQKRPGLFAPRNRRGLIDSFVYIAPRPPVPSSRRVTSRRGARKGSRVHKEKIARVHARDMRARLRRSGGKSTRRLMELEPPTPSSNASAKVALVEIRRACFVSCRAPFRVLSDARGSCDGFEEAARARLLSRYVPVGGFFEETQSLQHPSLEPSARLLSLSLSLSDLLYLSCFRGRRENYFY